MSKDLKPALTVLTPDAPGPESPEPPSPEERAMVAVDAWVRTLSEAVRVELSHNDLDALQRHIATLALDPEARALASQRWDCLEPPFVLGDV